MSNIDTQIDYAADVVKRLSSDYAELMNSVATTLEALRGLPKTIDDEATLEAYSKVIKDGRDLRKRLDAYHDAEKQPYLRSGQGVDQFFFGLEEKLARRKPRDPAGGLDIADARVDDYMQKKLAAERAERDRVAAEERAKAEAEQKRVDDARRAAEEAAAKAARARNEQNITAHREEAARQARIAEEARADEVLASQKAEDAAIDTKASAADMTRTRLDTGAVATMAQVPFVQIDDVTKLDKELLWPFLKEEHVLMALKAWAKTRSHKTPMAGATIELRNKGRVV
jgi:hypothetical protein